MRLHRKGLVYKGSYMVNWSPNLQTAVSDLEVCMLSSMTFLQVCFRTALKCANAQLTVRAHGLQ